MAKQSIDSYLVAESELTCFIEHSTVKRDDPKYRSVAIAAMLCYVSGSAQNLINRPKQFGEMQNAIKQKIVNLNIPIFLQEK